MELNSERIASRIRRSCNLIKSRRLVVTVVDVGNHDCNLVNKCYTLYNNKNYQFKI